MQTTHRILAGDARDLSAVGDGQVHLVVTSPPYPLVAMWDDGFAAMSSTAAAALAAEDGALAFEAMHIELDRVWAQCHRVLVDGGLACINIGDAARSLGGRFGLWPNHARILTGCMGMGLSPLPDILWRKPTNAPNKFMGSGMLPAGAYVTYEHEYVLVLRKGGGRAFPRPQDRQLRRESAYFWEERNQWFSDLWSDLRGTRQDLDRATRDRSGAFPVELPYRLALMFSLQGEVVLDPFGGTGTTALAAAMAGRSSISVERDPDLVTQARQRLANAVPLGQARAQQRLDEHRAFLSARKAAGKPDPKHHNAPHDLPVITGQEQELQLRVPRQLAPTAEGATCTLGPPLPPAQLGLDLG